MIMKKLSMLIPYFLKLQTQKVLKNKEKDKKNGTKPTEK